MPTLPNPLGRTLPRAPLPTADLGGELLELAVSSRIVIDAIDEGDQCIVEGAELTIVALLAPRDVGRVLGGLIAYGLDVELSKGGAQ